MRALLILAIVAVLGAVSTSAANPPWNPGGRTGTPTGIVAIQRPGWTQPVVGSTEDPAICNPVGVYSNADPFPDINQRNYCNIGGDF